MAATVVAIGLAGAPTSPNAFVAPAHAAAADTAAGGFSLSQDDTLFRAFGEEVTAGEWEAIVRFNPPPALQAVGQPFIKLADFSDEQVREGVKHYLRFEALRRQADADEDFQLGANELLDIEQSAVFAAQITWFEEKGMLEDVEISEEDVRARYEEVKDERFAQTEQLTLRHMFFSTYENYVVEEGDTLESIAETISGDASLADNILSPETRRARAEATTDAEGNEVPPRALRAGEELMVPMSAERAQAILDAARDVHQRLVDGEAFADVAAEVNELGPGRPNRPIVVQPARQDQPMLPEVVEAFHALEDGTFSEPFRTRHGYQIVKRVNYRPEGHRPFEEVREALAGQLVGEARQEAFQQILEDLWAENESIVVNRDAIMKGFDEEGANEEIFRIDDVVYSGTQFRRDYINRLDEDASFEERRAALVNQPIIQRTLVNEDIRRLGIYDSELYHARLRMMENETIANTFVGAKARSHDPGITEEQILERFEEMKPSIEARPSVDLWRLRIAAPLGMVVDDQWHNNTIRELQERLAEITTSEQFEALARELGTDEYAADGGRIGRVDNRWGGGTANRFIVTGETQRASEARRTSDGVEVYWVGDVYETTIPNLEHVRESIVSQLGNAARARYYEELLENALDGIDHEILIP